MKILSVLQIVLGLLIALSSLILGNIKAAMVPPLVPVISPTPSALFETVSFLLGIAGLICGLVQLKAHVRFARRQTFLWLIITVISAFLTIRTTRISYVERSYVYYLAYVSLALVLAVVVVGVAQLVAMRKRTQIVQ